MLNNRQNGRRRGRGRSPNPGGPRGNESRIDNRARGNAPQMLEKYKNLARDAQLSGDRVMTEYYLQFADHYFRIVAESRARFEEQRRQREDWSDEGDDGEDAEVRNEEADDGEENGGQRERQERHGQRDNRRDQRRGDSRRNDQRGEGRERGPRREQDGGTGYGVEGEPVEGVPAGPVIDVAVLPPALGVTADPMPDLDEEPAPTPKRRGRPRKVQDEAAAAEG